MGDCSIERHEAEKKSPAALAEHYDAHPEPWNLDGTILMMFHCRRCKSSVCVKVES